ncbi:trypsin-like serine protease [Synechococcales cyanobacterium C]|uniref:Trypsin-like serine protease n=1 Tax=Petrachloros mirabilis ULC683 TaxID=2781853 RepID=A0A8K2A6A9_9CYAN|nr:trypsin-like serine protease [Petrachloros mirabilis ULC683]
MDLPSLQRHAQAITVKVWADDVWGSGILIQQQGGRYWVLTNQHVLWMGKTYRVQTPDGRMHIASLVPGVRFGNNDLGLLKFSSPARYTVATLGSSLRLPMGTPVFAAGFPVPIEFEDKGLQFTTGQISLIMPKAFDGGYQVGYSNTIEKGMSGGPLLNRQGEVIGVNGIHQAPLWGNPYVFQDGSTPDLDWDSLARSSWAIPIETVRRHL